ncbi:TPA: VWA domain-containing protein [Staphylococcus pseudintermedius]|nr:VWA domain-containing protein [Staphylococcus pseudintermedius]
MSDRFIMFNDEQLDAMKMMMLQDLARLLLKNPNTQVKVHKFPYYDAINDEVICSSFWAHRPEYVEHTGLKTDVLLATYSYFHMDPQIVNKVVANEEGFNHPKLYRQLFKMMEEMRILNLVETEKIESKNIDSKSAGGAYLEMELHEGENSDVLGDDSAREGDSTDDMTDMMSKKGKGSNDTLDDQEGGEQGPSNALLSLKGINQYVDIKWHVPDILPEYIESYRQVQTSVQFEIKDLIQIIKKTIDREYQDVRANLTKGRLQRNLVNWFIDDQYKLFYKKADQSRTFDATFTLLIDASASMHDKMDETIKGVVLFHETLKALNVKHEILAFNEDAFDADAQYQPNIIDEIINYHQSTFNTEAPRIMSLTPQDDNRDGVAIRVASDRLLSRSEQQRFLIVFSDGEPSAFNYSQDGILDTYEAVENSRKLGIEVFNVFLSQESITESTEQTIHNIYGQYAIFVEGVEHLPSLLSPLLKKLLLKSF